MAPFVTARRSKGGSNGSPDNDRLPWGDPVEFNEVLLLFTRDAEDRERLREDSALHYNPVRVLIFRSFDFPPPAV
jgi:hypothetical protein